MVFAFMLFVINCNAQEHLTCLRTDDVLYPSRQPPPRIKQGIPGKRGPRGEAGLTGSKGEKGEPGVPDVSEINMLRGKVNICLLENTKQLKFLHFQINCFNYSKSTILKQHR